MPTPVPTPTPVVLPDYPAGGRIAFQTDRDGNDEIYVMGCDGSQQVNLTNHFADDKEPSWASGGRLAFSSNRNVAGGFDIYLLTLNPWGITRLTTHPANDRSPALSPDGGKAAFVSHRDGNAEIYVLDLSSNALVRVTAHSAEDLDPAWSPDGGALAFASNRHGQFDIYTVKPDGSGLAKSADVSGDGANERWPDLEHYYGDEIIAFASDRDKGWEVYFYSEYDGLLAVTRNGKDQTDAQPGWSGSSEQMVYHSNRDGDGSYDIFKAYYDGAGAINLTNGTMGNDFSPDWEPQEETDFCEGDE